MSDEITLYQDDTIHITTARAVLGTKTYAMSNVTSVSMAVIPANKTGSCLLMAVGVILILMALIVGPWALMGIGIKDYALGGFAVVMIVLGLIAIAGGFSVSKGEHPSYGVRIGSASGESNVLVSKDKGYIETIVNAMNDAIAKRG